MKKALLAAFMIGCAHTQPSPPAIEVVVIQIPMPRTTGRIVEVIQIGEESNEVPHTWMTKEEIERLNHERLIKEHPECDCHPGDPLCSCL